MLNYNVPSKHRFFWGGGEYNLKLIVEYVSEYLIKLPKLDLLCITRIKMDDIKKIRTYLDKIINSK